MRREKWIFGVTADFERGQRGRSHNLGGVVGRSGSVFVCVCRPSRHGGGWFWDRRKEKVVCNRSLYFLNATSYFVINASNWIMNLRNYGKYCRTYFRIVLKLLIKLNKQTITDENNFICILAETVFVKCLLIQINKYIQLTIINKNYFSTA